ncbi:biopolymer transporter ExbD [Fontisphaera persica]|jgi:biopolymer transport protein ExbD|uniref:ExbD/TolR family protein n=1 Tax=Fontisphaera persica TaxID=2974023 RepID=UPI0024C09993|nr:biopolymer transporter ExbD [Fontisphaera persica]WCJ59493.1 biopolymer transporter ExbD [Fontisphaera persica]
MKKYSENKHHTLSELNITPLLDLAFVLLVIFIITTAPPVNDINISLPTAAGRPKEAPSKANYITVDRSGNIFLNTVPMNLDQLLKTLVDFRKVDPDLNVVVRGDSRINYQKIIDVLDVLVSAKIEKVGLATETYGQQ